MKNNLLIIYIDNLFNKSKSQIQGFISALDSKIEKAVIICNDDSDTFEYSNKVLQIYRCNKDFVQSCMQYCNEHKDSMSDYSNIYMISTMLAGPVADINNLFGRMKEFSSWTLTKSMNGFICASVSDVCSGKLWNDIDNNLAECASMSNCMLEPYKMIVNEQIPFVNMYAYIQEKKNVLEFSAGEELSQSVKYIADNTNYDVNIIWDNIIACGNMSDIVYNLNLTYILPADKANPIPDVKIAMILHIYYEDLAMGCFEYAKSMPKSSDIYITTDTKEKCDRIKKIFEQGDFNKVETIVIENRGRDVSALLTGAKHIVNEYDYVLFVHDKKVEHMDSKIKGESFSYKCFDNLLKSKEFVANIIDVFEKNERLGLLCPPPPNHANYYPTLGYFDWGMNYANTLELGKKLGLKCRIEWNKEPISPLGTMFWFRTKAMKKLFDCDWQYEDFPPEPNGIDGTLLHAIERIYGFVTQDEGYYNGWLLNSEFAGMELDNMYYMIKELDKKIFNVYGAGTFNYLCDSIAQANVNYDLIKNISTARFIRGKLSNLYHRLIRK